MPDLYRPPRDHSLYTGPRSGRPPKHGSARAAPGCRDPTEWPGADFAEILPLISKGLAEDPTGSEWTRLIIHQANRTLIGDIGFLSPPGPEQVVEIGYSIIPTHRQQGYAFEAAQAMISWAFSWPSVRR